MRGLQLRFGTDDPVVLFEGLYGVLGLGAHAMQLGAQDRDIVHVLDHNRFTRVQALYIHAFVR